MLPIVIALKKMCEASPATKAEVKRLIFPPEADAVWQERLAQQLAEDEQLTDPDEVCCVVNPKLRSEQKHARYDRNSWYQLEPVRLNLLRLPNRYLGLIS